MTYLIDFLSALAVGSAVTVGAHLAFIELWFTRYESEPPKHWWLKPLATCPTCMASVWGTLMHFIIVGDVATWPLFVLASAFTNTLFNRWTS